MFEKPNGFETAVYFFFLLVSALATVLLTIIK